ncbi:MAG: serine/threonine protein kinase [Frankiales bacterium]|nr:serine/threonine protein kinase [Frankiales bacterium]
MTSPSGPRTPSRPALDSGDVLADRYQLVREVSDGGGPTSVWLATDEVLARRVAVKLLPASGRAGAAAARPFLEAAGRASSLSHPGLARVYDAALEERPAARGSRTVDVAYVISEWVDGRTLSDLLRSDGPLDPADAVRLAHDAAGAVGAAHDARVGHGRIHPGNLMVTPAGRLRVTDAAVAAAVHGSPLPPLGDGEPLGGPEIARDTRDLAAVVYAMLTARWPAGSTPQPAAGLAAAPKPAGGALYAPRQVRAGVPRSLDTVVVRALEPGREPGRNPITSPRALAQALDEAGHDLRAPAAAAAPTRRGPSRLWRLAPKLIALAVLIAIGISSYSLGKKVGELPRKQGALDALAQPSPSPDTAGPVTSRIDLSKPPVVVRDYDPFGRDGAEQHGSVPNAYDGDPTTAWTTDGYGSAAFGGLKPGVGLLVDLGRPTRIASVQVGLATPGASIELRSTDLVGDNADSFTTVARQSDAKQIATLTPTGPRPARYWLVWFTSLPKGAGGRFREGIAELVFNSAAG